MRCQDYGLFRVVGRGNGMKWGCHPPRRINAPPASVPTPAPGTHPPPSPWQVRLMSETSILVTPCGGLATVLTFLRPGATAIAMNYWSTLRNRSAQLEDIYYRCVRVWVDRASHE